MYSFLKIIKNLRKIILIELISLSLSFNIGLIQMKKTKNKNLNLVKKGIYKFQKVDNLISFNIQKWFQFGEYTKFL